MAGAEVGDAAGGVLGLQPVPLRVMRYRRPLTRWLDGPDAGPSRGIARGTERHELLVEWGLGSAGGAEQEGVMSFSRARRTAKRVKRSGGQVACPIAHMADVEYYC